LILSSCISDYISFFIRKRYFAIGSRAKGES
jgi:hypothetical protein